MNIRKILLLGPNVDMSIHGGIVTHMKLLNTLSNNDNFDFEIRTFTLGKRSFMGEKISLIKILYSYLYYFNTLLFNKYDIVHINASMTNSSILKNFIALLIGKLFFKKVVFQFHGGDPDNIKTFYTYFLKKIVHLSDVILVLTDEQATIGDYAKLSEQSKVKKIPNYMHVRDVDINSRKNLKDIHFLFLGRVIKEKGIFEIIDAVKKLSKKLKNFRVDVMGDGPELKKMREMVENTGLNHFFVFHGFVTVGKDEIFRDSHILLFPTWKEAFPYVALESMLFKMPMITTRVGALSEIVDDGKNGFLINSRDVDALSDKMEYFLLNPQQIETFGEQSFEILEQRYSTEIMKKNFTAIYNGVLE